jgi:hypothetical protein
MNLQLEKDSITLSLNTRIYKVKSIVATAEAFSQNFIVDVRSCADRVEVRIKPKAKNVELKDVGYEFFNYVLADSQSSLFSE